MGIQTSTINNGPTAGFKNVLINGNFDIWQYSTSQTIGTTPAIRYFTTDRWFNFFDGSGATRTVSRQAFTLGQTDVPDNPKYFYRLAQTVAGTGATYNLLTQRIESVFTLAGQQVTVSFWAKAASALTMTVNVAQGFGNGGSPSASVVAFTSSNLNVTTSWQKFTVTGTIPSISGKTLGTNNDDNLTFQFIFPFNTTFTIDIAHVQFEEGPVATDFERRPVGTELALCQRYCYVWTADAASSSSARQWQCQAIDVGSSSFAGTPYMIQYKVPMRTTASVSPTPTASRTAGAAPTVIATDVRTGDLHSTILAYFSAATTAGVNVILNSSTYTFTAEL